MTCLRTRPGSKGSFERFLAGRFQTTQSPGFLILSSILKSRGQRRPCRKIHEPNSGMSLSFGPRADLRLRVAVNAASQARNTHCFVNFRKTFSFRLEGGTPGHGLLQNPPISTSAARAYFSRELEAGFARRVVEES